MERQKLTTQSTQIQWGQLDKPLYDGVELTQAQEGYMLPHFTMLLVGKPGSGKTQLLTQLITNKSLYFKKFDTVYMISPSHAKMGLPMPDENMTDSFNLDWVFKKIDEVNDKQAKVIKSSNKGHVSVTGGASKGRLHTQSVLTKAQVGGSLIGGKDSHLYQNQFESKTLKKANDLGFEIKTATRGASKAGAASTTEAMVRQSQQQDLFKLVRAMGPDEQRKTHKNVLIIFDDVIAGIKKAEFDPRLAQLFMNRRHLIANATISTIVVSQKYTLIPSRIRSNASWLIFFHLNPRDLETIYEDAVLMKKQQWIELLKFVFGSVDGFDDSADTQQKKYTNLGIWIEKNTFFVNLAKIGSGGEAQMEGDAQLENMETQAQEDQGGQEEQKQAWQRY